MKRRIIVNVYDDKLSIGNAIELLNLISYDTSRGWTKECIWGTNKGNWIKADASGKSLKFDIWREDE